MMSPTRPLSVAALPHEVTHRASRRRLRQAREVVIGGHAQRVVDVDDHRVGLRQQLDAVDTHPRIEAIGPYLRQLDQLRRDIEVAGVGQRRQAAGRVELLHLGDATAARVGAQVLPQQVVREVRELTLVPRARAASMSGASASGSATCTRSRISSRWARA
ncbi:MAG: hypothetical protein IPK74_28965 [Deltaproteobacteria bacterium]|nr:hypothetical protein [Deltaproteobacteria bacterium]